MGSEAHRTEVRAAVCVSGEVESTDGAERIYVHSAERDRVGGGEALTHRRIVADHTGSHDSSK